MLQVKDVVSRVAAKCDDQGQTYVDTDYLLGFVDDVSDWLFGKLRLGNTQFAEEVIVLPAVAAGTPNFDTFMQNGQPLGSLVLPKFVRWKLPGQSNLYWRRADGPLDYPRELNPGGPYLDSWAWVRNSVMLANFNIALDLEVTGDFLFARVTDPEAQLTMTQLANRIFTSKLASEVGKARGNDKWTTTYGADADDALDDLLIAMSKENQKKTHRVGRMSRRGTGGASTSFTR